MAIKLASANLNAREFLGTISQGVISLSLDTPAWGADFKTGGTITVTLDVNEGPANRNYAPQSVVIHANAAGFHGEGLSSPEWDASFHRLTYIHDTGDIHCGDYKWADRLNIKSRRLVHAKMSAHVYREPGTYNHSVLVYDHAGNWGYASTTIVVTAPNHAPTHIVVLAPDGDSTNAPHCIGANRVTTWADARTRLDAIGNSTGPRALMLKRGSEILCTTTIGLDDTDVLPWGIGPNVMVDLPAGPSSPGLAFRAWGTRTKIQGVDTRGSWNPVSERGAPDGDMAQYLTTMTSGLLIDCSAGSKSDILIDLCNGSNTEDTYIRIGADAENARTVINECSLRDFKNYFTMGGNSVESAAIALIGNKVEQHPQAASGGQPRWFLNPEVPGHAGWYPGNAHSGSRFGGARNVLIIGNDGFTRHGWTTQSFDVYATNALYRLNSDGILGAIAWIINNWIEAPAQTYNASGGTMNWGAYLWEFNTFIGDPTSGTCLGAGGTGNTVRNNLFIFPEVVGQRAQVRTAVDLANDSEDHTLSRNEIYSNTLIDLTTEAQHAAGFEPFKIGPAGTNGLSENNAYYAPNRTPAITADGPFVYPADVEGILGDPRYLGRRKSYEYWADHYTLPSAVAPGGSFTMPYRTDRLDIMLTQDDFDGEWGKHNIRLSTTGIVQEVPGNMSVTFGPSGITVTNLTSATWAAGEVVTAWLDRGDTAMAMDETSKSLPGSFDLGWSTTASGTHASATAGLVGLLDLRGRPRAGSGHADAPAGTPSRGAYEVAA